jgi:sucrose-6-phosphate hydrolase SacC (GH32 family)
LDSICQVLFGWVNYNCPGTDWTGIQSFPRSVTLDPANDTKIVTNPIAEITALYTKTDSMKDVTVPAGGKPLLIGNGTQLDVEMTFKLDGTATQTFGFGALTAADGTGGKRTTIKTNTGAGPAPLSPYMDGTDLPGGDMRTGMVYECMSVWCMVYGV